MEREELMELLEDDFISALVDMEIAGKGWDSIEEAMNEYAEQNGIEYEDLRRMYGEELENRGLL